MVELVVVVVEGNMAEPGCAKPLGAPCDAPCDAMGAGPVVGRGQFLFGRAGSGAGLAELSERPGGCGAPRLSLAPKMASGPWPLSFSSHPHLVSVSHDTNEILYPSCWTDYRSQR